MQRTFGAQRSDQAGSTPVAPAATPAPVSAGSDADEAQIAAYVARVEARNRAIVPALSAFQQQMDRYRPLDGDEQRRLLGEYRDGMAARELIKAGNAGRNQAALESAARRGEYALEHLLGSMLKLTLLIARENAEERYGRERAAELLPDLVSEANLALTEAVAGYDEERCPSFAIYAGRVIRDRIRMALARDSAVKLPPSWIRIKRIASVRMPVLAESLGRKPSTRELQADLLARCMEWAAGKLTEAQLTLPRAEREQAQLAKLRKQGMLSAIERIEDVLVATQSVASLDTPLGDDGSASLGDMLANPTRDSTFDNVELGALRTALQEALAGLTPRESQILLYRFGFVDGECWTYQRICEQYQVTAERIRQIERNVLAKLRAPSGPGSRLAAFLPSRMDAIEAEASSQRSAPTAWAA